MKKMIKNQNKKHFINFYGKICNDFFERKIMKKFLLSLLLIAGVGSASAVSLVQEYRGAYDASSPYKAFPLKNTNKTAAPVVTYQGSSYIYTSLAQVTNTAPTTGGGWTLLSGLSGSLVKTGSGSFTSIAFGAEATVSPTYTVACPTAVDTLLVTAVNATATVPLDVKISASSLSGFSAIVHNSSGSTASGAGTINYLVVCH